MPQLRTTVAGLAAATVVAAATFITLAPTDYEGITPYAYQTQFAYTGHTRTFRWCQPETATPWTQWPDLTYELQVIHFETGEIVTDVRGIQAMFYNWTPPKVGHFVARVRNRVTINGNEHLSTWTLSTEGSAGDGICTEQVEPWWLYAWLAPPGGGIIN